MFKAIEALGVAPQVTVIFQILTPSMFPVPHALSVYEKNGQGSVVAGNPPSASAGSGTKKPLTGPVVKFALIARAAAFPSNI